MTTSTSGSVDHSSCADILKDEVAIHRTNVKAVGARTGIIAEEEVDVTSRLSELGAIEAADRSCSDYCVGGFFFTNASIVGSDPIGLQSVGRNLR